MPYGRIVKPLSYACVRYGFANHILLPGVMFNLMEMFFAVKIILNIYHCESVNKLYTYKISYYYTRGKTKAYNHNFRIGL